MGLPLASLKLSDSELFTVKMALERIKLDIESHVIEYKEGSDPRFCTQLANAYSIINKIDRLVPNLLPF